MRSTKASRDWPTPISHSKQARTRLGTALLLACCLCSVATARADTPADLLPDIDQSPPDIGGIYIQKVSGQWRFAFGSEIYNRGQGDLMLHGSRADLSTSTMTVTQTIEQTGGSTRTVGVPGALQYVQANHNHWHLLGLEHYELRSLHDPNRIVSDHKTGFCLADLSPNNCELNNMSALAVDEGVRVSTGPDSGNDYYSPMLEGQYVDIDPVNTPAGRYSLTHRSNVDHALLESNYDNNAASAEIQLDWTADGTPTYKFIQTCPDSAVCGTPDPQPQPGPGPQPDPQTQPQGQPEPQQGPFVPPLTVEQTALGPKVRMSRDDAVRLTREAIRRTLKGTPRSLTAHCARRGEAKFSCRGGWRVRRERWEGHATVWYRVRGRSLVWYFSLQGHSGPRRIRVHSVEAGARPAWAAAAANRDLFCHRVVPAAPSQRVSEA